MLLSFTGQARTRSFGQPTAGAERDPVGRLQPQVVQTLGGMSGCSSRHRCVL